MNIFIAFVFTICLAASMLTINAMIAQYLAFVKQVKTHYTHSVNFYLTATCIFWGLFYYLTH